MSTLNYAIEKYGQAIEGFATGPGDVRERLRSVCKHIAFISPTHVPDSEKLQQDITWILDQMNKYAGDLHETSMETMMRRVQERTETKIAKRIHKVWSTLCWQARAQRPKR